MVHAMLDAPTKPYPTEILVKPTDSIPILDHLQVILRGLQIVQQRTGDSVMHVRAICICC